MAGQEPTEGSSSTRRRMAVNLYAGLPPLPRPQVRLNASAASPMTLMPNMTGAALEAPRTGEPKESLAPVVAVAGEPEKDGSCNCKYNFECNICFDVAKAPVVTSCGHLFCWPCLYQWMKGQSHIPECPICKGAVVEGNITPIYGRASEEGDSTANTDCPPRPAANRRDSLRQQLRMVGIGDELALEMTQLIQNRGIVGGPLPPSRTETTSVPTAAQGLLAVAAPRQSSSVEHLPTPTARVGEPGPSRRSRRPSVSPTIRTTRRRPE